MSRSWAAALAGQRWKVRQTPRSSSSRGEVVSVRIQLKHSLTRQTVRLRVADLENLLELARDWMPRYGTKVKTVQLTWWTDDDLRDLRRIRDTPERQQAASAAESFIGLGSPYPSGWRETFDLPDALVAEILQACSNFLHIRLIEQTLIPVIVCAETNERNEISVHSGITSRRTRCALQVAGSRISAADLSFERFVLAAEKYLDVLDMVPNVEHLSLRISRDHLFFMPDFFLRLFQPQKLASLELSDTGISTLTALSAQPCSTLTQLVLSGMPSLQLAELADLLKVHPVTTLCLHDISLSDTQRPFSAPETFKLQNLSVTVETDGALLDLFDAAPLKKVEFCARRGGDTSNRITPQRITAFIKKHRASLLSFKADRVLFDAAEKSEINRSLEEEDISVRVVTIE